MDTNDVTLLVAKNGALDFKIDPSSFEFNTINNNEQ
jgi:hypothetical protein